MSRFKPLGLILRVAISLAAIGALGYALRGKFDEAFLIFRRGIDWPWFLWGLGLFLVGTAFISRRLQLTLRVQDVKVGFLDTCYLSFVGLFFTLFFPSAFGGDVAKGYFAYQYSGKKLGSLTGVLLDRILGFVTLLAMALFAITVYSHQLEMPGMRRTLYGLVGLLTFGTVFFANHRFAKKFQFLAFLIPSAKLREKLANLYHAIREYRNHKQVLISCCIISVMAQVGFIGQSYFLARSIDLQVSFWFFFILLPLVAFVSLAPSLSGLGVREAGVVFFLKDLVPTEQAFALALLFDVVFYGAALLGGLMFAVRGGLKREVLQGLEVVEQEEA